MRRREAWWEGVEADGTERRIRRGGLRVERVDRKSGDMKEMEI